MNAASWLEGLPAPDKWRAIAMTHGPRWATWALALALGVQGAFILTDLAGSGRAPAATNGPPPSAPPSRSVNVAAISGSHLFGTVEITPTQRSAATAQQTSMALVLTGIFASSDPRGGLAMLGPTATSTKVYAVGDNVPGGAKLHSVLVDRVVLDRNGVLEYLAMPRQPQGGMANAPAPSANALQTENPVVDRMRRIITDDPGLVADIMRPQPVFAQGKLRGYRVYPGRNRQSFTRLGLRPGDLVTAINGTPLEDPQQSQDVFRTIGATNEARVTVTRNGQSQDLVLNMSQVAQEAEALVGTQPGQGGGPPEPPAQGAPATPPSVQ
ncbi:MAG TPA: type II secretion system protein GspC [Steroidobacteraceae bacterium]|jgi:general secretion pathway protein C